MNLDGLEIPNPLRLEILMKIEIQFVCIQTKITKIFNYVIDQLVFRRIQRFRKPAARVP